MWWIQNASYACLQIGKTCMDSFKQKMIPVIFCPFTITLFQSNMSNPMRPHCVRVSGIHG